MGVRALRMNTKFRPGKSLLSNLRRSVGVLSVSLLLGAFLVSLPASIEALPRLQSQAAVPDAAEQTLFVKGQNLFGQSLYHEAAAVFGDFLKAYPQSQIKDLALLWLGRCHIRVGDVGAAEQVAARLRQLSDTQFVDLYEEELRVARQGLAKTRTQPPMLQPRYIAPGLTAAAPEPPHPVAAVPSAVVPSPGKINTPAETKPLEQAAAKRSVSTLTAAPLPQAKRTSPVIEPKNLVPLPGPLVRIRLEQTAANATVGVVTFYRLLIVNEGKGVARNLVISELLPADLEFASSDPAPSRQEMIGRSQSLTFQILELKPGATRALRIAVRPRVGAEPAAILKAKHTVSYQDSELRNYLTN